MPAIAAVVNGAVTPVGKTINLYYNTPTAQAALALKSGSNAPDESSEYWAADDNDYKGYILNPSEIASAQFLGVNTVVAATVPNVPANTTPTVNNISLVSPVYQTLTTTTLANKKVAIASAGDRAWVYYLSGSSKNDVSLKEHNLVTHNNSTYLQNLDVTLNSSLASWYDTIINQRIVVYQEVTQNHLKEYNVNTNQAHDIDSTGDAKALTTIAVTYFDGKVYLFYTDGPGNLRKIIKDNNGWGSPKPIGGSPRVAKESQLTVTTANGYNHIFYISTEDIPNFAASTRFTHIRDPVS